MTFDDSPDARLARRVLLDAITAETMAGAGMAPIRDAIREARAKALEEAAEESERDAARWGIDSHSAAWLRNRASRERTR
jgi:hypothetical protein